MLSKIRKLAFKIHQLGYCYLPTNPITWDSTYNKLQYINSKRCKFYFLISLILCTLVSGGAAYVVFTHFAIRRRENYNIGFIGLHIVCVELTGLPVIIALVIYRNPEFMQGVNALLCFKERSFTCKSNLRKSVSLNKLT